MGKPFVTVPLISRSPRLPQKSPPPCLRPQTFPSPLFIFKTPDPCCPLPALLSGTQASPPSFLPPKICPFVMQPTPPHLAPDPCLREILHLFIGVACAWMLMVANNIVAQTF